MNNKNQSDGNRCVFNILILKRLCTTFRTDENWKVIPKLIGPNEKAVVPIARL